MFLKCVYPICTMALYNARVQKGSIKAHGKWWVLKYRSDVLKNGVKVRHDSYKKLAPIDRDHQAKSDGSPPEKVKAMATLELAPLNAGLHHPHSVDSVLSFLETFLAKGEGGRGRMLNPTSRMSYRAMFAMVKDFIPNIQMRQVRTMHIDKILRDVAANDGDDRRAQTSYANIKGFLSSAFRYALRHGLVESNPVRDVAIPEGNAADTHAYTEKEVHGFLHALKQPITRAAIVVAYLTGLRPEEIKGLRWEDYDGLVINVRRAVVHGEVVRVKTDASQAPVPVVKTVAKVLAAHRKLNPSDGFIFYGETLEPIILENLAKRYIVPTLKAAGLKWHGFHAFRRGLGTRLHALGTPELTIKHILRHSTKDVTTKHYIKSDDGLSRAALERVELELLKLKPRLKF